MAHPTPHPISPFSPEQLAEARAQLAGATAAEVLAWVERRFGAFAVIASSFGVEDTVLIDLASRYAPEVRVFTLDTGRLHPETYETMEAVRLRYRLEIQTFFPDRGGIEELEQTRGYFSFRESLAERQRCCGIRKVEPLQRALQGRQAWLTGLRRGQSSTRTAVEVVECDLAHGGIAKLNPLAGWSDRELWEYVRENSVPYHPLHDRLYPSIGCAPCTRAIKPYEDIRAGRWWWESPEHKECGLHRRG